MPTARPDRSGASPADAAVASRAEAPRVNDKDHGDIAGQSIFFEANWDRYHDRELSQEQVLNIIKSARKISGGYALQRARVIEIVSGVHKTTRGQRPLHGFQPDHRMHVTVRLDPGGTRHINLHQPDAKTYAVWSITRWRQGHEQHKRG